MLSGNFCDLELQTNNIEWGSRVFSTVYCAIKRVVLFGTLKVLLKDNVSTNYVADCRFELLNQNTMVNRIKAADRSSSNRTIVCWLSMAFNMSLSTFRSADSTLWWRL